MTTNIEQRYLSVAEAARYLGLSRKTLYSWAEKGTMPAYKVGRVWRFDKSELDSFVKRAGGTTVLYNPLQCSEPERKEA